MCDYLGTAVARIDHTDKTLHGWIICQCGEREIPISETPNGVSTLGFHYDPKPNLTHKFL